MSLKNLKVLEAWSTIITSGELTAYNVNQFFQFTSKTRSLVHASSHLSWQEQSPVTNANATYDFHHGIRDVKNDAICFVLNSPPQ